MLRLKDLLLPDTRQQKAPIGVYFMWAFPMGSIPNPICNPTQGKSSIISLSQIISATLSIHSRPNICNQYFIEGFRTGKWQSNGKFADHQ